MVCSSENRVCGFEGARHLQHEAMTFSAWLEYISKEHPNAIPLKTLLVNTKDKSEKCIYTLPADQKADIKCLGKTIGMNPNALRVAAPKDIQETFSLPSESVFSLLHITMQPALLKKDGLKFRLCFDSSLLSVESPSRTVVLGHPVPNAGSVLIEHPVLLEGIRQLLPSEEILNVRAVPCEGTDSTYKQDAEKPKISQSTQKKDASGVQRKGKAGEGLEADKSASDETGGASGTGLVIRHAKEENFQEWYAEVLTKADLIEYHDVSGCYILRPWAYRMWEVIKDFLDHKLRDDGVDNTYFPLFISQGALEREKDHVEGFAPEVAWVTKSGQSDLAEPIAIRPTSETVMYPSYAKWIRSHRDLPLRLNQWCNVVRWEFSHPMPFIRTREFLWQEGHTAWATLQEATREVHWSLDLYRQVYEDLLCVPVVQGRKTDKEKFAGALFTTTVETFVPSTGRGCQGGTSHCLGQGFAKMFDIVFEDETRQRQYVWQNSFGMTTRTIGVMIMVHGDDKGLVLPPPVAYYQVVIVPCGIQAKTTEEEKSDLLAACTKLCAQLKQAGVRSHADLRMHQSPGWRYNYWEQRGVPLRIELGPRELKASNYVACRRDTGEKTSIPQVDVGANVKSLLETIRQNMFERAKATRDARLKQVTDWKEFVPLLNQKCMLLSPWCGDQGCEDEIKQVSANESKQLIQRDENGAEDMRAPSMGAKSLCIPFDQPAGAQGCTCIAPSCEKRAAMFTLFGRSY